MSHPPRIVLLACLFASLLFSGIAAGQTITGLMPSSVQAGSGGFVLTIAGSGFNSGSVVRLHTANGIQPLQTYFINTGMLMAGVYADDVAQSGSVEVDVADYAAETASQPLVLTVSGTSAGSGSGSSGSAGSSGDTGSGSASGSGAGSSSGTGSGSGSSSAGSGSGSSSSGGSSAGCYGCYSPSSGSTSSSGSGSSGSSSGSGSTGDGAGTGAGSGTGSSAGTGSSGASPTSPAGSSLLVTVSSPSPHQSVNGSVTITATAAQTSHTDGSVAFWGIFDAGKLLWTDVNPDPSIGVNLALSAGLHTLQVVAYDDSYTASTAAVPVVSASSGITVTWNACIYTSQGQQYQAMRVSPSQPITGVIQSEMFWNENCDPVQWTDQLNDVGTPVTLGSAFSEIYYFIHRANNPYVSAVWTIGNQTSGCVNYNTAPACN
ncbi:hypothetical protein [Paracidobacterium acidisoli]|uniref:IPT/TIG domain-containing protein n=1 Tax=Paracidobacterium acidisoli TaxID=2303751 RepID=A0A372ITF8_9BACT|nr:hypothetical protein [Paracidobacterium acidisoli]MBT9329588.1 hypothetical protein [Paracidobacterium acidisoli]